MSMSSYVPGDRVRLSAAFTVGSVATDPTTVVCVVRAPDGTETTYNAPTHDSTGNYHVDHDLTAAKAGVYAQRWTGTGACQAAMEAEFFVQASAF